MEHFLKSGRQRLQQYVRRFAQKGEAEKSLAADLQQEREKRWRAETKLRQIRNETVAPEGSGRTRALPRADETMNRRQIFMSLIAPLKPGRMLDLGAGPGTFSLAAAELGWEVAAVDARTIRTPDAEVEDKANRIELIRSVRWVEADVRHFPIGRGEYDLICIFGLMHHLRVEDQINLLERCSETLTYLSVRVAPDIFDREGPYEGLYHREPGDTREERDQIPIASWGNNYSFSHTEESLIRLLRDCGYSKVLLMRPPHKPNYTFYVALPSVTPEQT